MVGKKRTHQRRKNSSAEGPLFPRNCRAIVGDHAIAEALLCHPQWVQELWLKQGFESSKDLKKLAMDWKERVPRFEIKSEEVLNRLARSHQGAALILNQAPKVKWNLLDGEVSSILIVSDGIEDPHNLGAILRTSWLTGVDGILVPQDRSVHLTPTVHKVACGGVEHVPVEIVPGFGQVLGDLKNKGYWVFGLGNRGKTNLFDVRIPEKVIWCVGAEDKGLRSSTERLCDEIVRIPQSDVASSYNASIAMAMALIETLRQRNRK